MISSDDIKADDKKFMLSQFTSTKQQTRVKKFFGTLNYLGECIPNLSIESVNLRRLLEKNNKFVFDNPQTDAFDRLKRLVAHT